MLRFLCIKSPKLELLQLSVSRERSFSLLSVDYTSFWLCFKTVLPPLICCFIDKFRWAIVPFATVFSVYVPILSAIDVPIHARVRHRMLAPYVNPARPKHDRRRLIMVWIFVLLNLQKSPLKTAFLFGFWKFLSILFALLIDLGHNIRAFRFSPWPRRFWELDREPSSRFRLLWPN